MADYVVRPADLDRDRDDIVAVWVRNLRSHDEATHRRKYDWYYRQNPLGPGRCWVLENGAGSVVGTAGLGLRRIHGRDRTFLAGLASDFAVDPSHRSLRPALMLARAVVGELDNGLALIYGLPNSQATPIFRRVGYNLDASLTRHVKVLRSERYLRSRVRPALARQAIAGIVDRAIRVASSETWRPSRGRVVQEAASFDGRFDDVWRRASEGAGTIMERSASFLDWRYPRCPLCQYVTLTLTETGRDELLGYAVCYVRDDEQVAIVDLVAAAAEGDPGRNRLDLLAGVIRWARGRGAASIACELSGAEGLASALAEFGFRPRGETLRIAVATRDGAASVNDWYFLRADEDYN